MNRHFTPTSVEECDLETQLIYFCFLDLLFCTIRDFLVNHKTKSLNQNHKSPPNDIMYFKLNCIFGTTYFFMNHRCLLDKGFE